MNAFEKALEFTLRWEGGYVNHPADPGGATNFGVTQGIYDTYRTKYGKPKQSVKSITKQERDDIYRTGYWLEGQCDKIALISEPLSVAHFDACVNMGCRQAAKFVQRAACVVNDGKIGPKTLEAIKATMVEGRNITESCIFQRDAYYKNLVEAKPKMKVFLKGWLNRTNDLKAFVKKEVK